MELTKEELKVIMKFMERVEMKGTESIAYVGVMQKMANMIDAPPEKDKEDCPTCDEEKDEDCPICEE